MGLLTTGGPPMRWGAPENDAAIPYVRKHGIAQFLNVYHRYKDVSDAPFLWGEEIEHLVLSLPPRPAAAGGGAAASETTEGKDAKVSLTADPLIQQLRQEKTDSKWLPEYGSYMIETTPDEPYSMEKQSLLSCEGVIQRRYDLLRQVTSGPGDNRVVVTLVAFPRMGQPDFIEGMSAMTIPGEFSSSIFIPEEATNQTHPRFGNLTRNIRLRRGRKVCIQVPIFIDTHTLERSVDNTYRIDKHPNNGLIDCQPAEEPKTSGFDDEDATTTAAEGKDAKDVDASVHAFTHLYTPSTHYYYAQYNGHADKEAQKDQVMHRYEACPCPVPSVTHPCVYMDSMAFGMGMSCLQVTMQMPDVSIGRHVYDQLTTLCPMFLALTAATPIQKGFLVESDVRWLTIAASVDCRKRSEVPRIIKSRYDSVSLYISPRPESLDAFNDNAVEVNPEVMEQLKGEGIDERLARHFSHLFIRDPLVIYEGRVESLDDSKETDHFENIQSTNWQTVRFKPPPSPESNIGWRVEFRVMEVQMTAFENSAFSVFIVLLTRAIMKYDLWLYVPMSKVDQNMGRAHARDAVSSKYWFTKSTTRGASGQGEAVELSMNELFNGCEQFVGFVPLVRRFVKEERLDDPRMEQYFELISRRASGELQTAAAFMRDLVRHHPDYKQDSAVSPAIAHDIIRVADDLSAGKLAFDSFLPATLLTPAAGSAAAAGDRKRTAAGAAPGAPPLKASH